MIKFGLIFYLAYSMCRENRFWGTYESLSNEIGSPLWYNYTVNKGQN